MKKIILIILILNFNLFALELSSNLVNNANTVLLEIEKENIKDVKLTFDKQNINFNKNPFKKNSFYALLPISYYQELKEYRIIISYLENNKRVFVGKDLKVVDGNYKSEVINVKPSKFKPPKSRVERTKKEYSDAMKVYNSKSEKLYWSEDFIYPLNSKITSNFGTKRVYNGELKSYHSGTDFRAKNNTPIIASNSGIVRIAQDRFYAGNSIIIDHGHGVYSCYFHLNKMNFKVGDFIKKGEVLGLSGNTGRSTGPHLHFAFRIHGIQVDPLQAIEVLNSINN
ncbi:peptidase M23 [Malaciobacter pacificus]|uniref:Zinc metallopeptidase, M23 family n=1 Tax=Malaciobacter pacificus TaxID=1080223 RepID=A0A5C2HAE3_9BACT|nr:M23 family metallopeptidase [Malaciobacter pacificus]QEP34136.1 zinc metallopeptidase, M23 family [Malaciobacter pacificus]GGD47205.1 peptidase M23 [Malaciobacter pacificus]